MRTYLRSPNCWRSSPRSSSSESKDRFLRNTTDNRRSIRREWKPQSGWVRHQLKWSPARKYPPVLCSRSVTTQSRGPKGQSLSLWTLLCPSASIDHPSCINQSLLRDFKTWTYAKTQSCRQRFISKPQHTTIGKFLETEMFCSLIWMMHVSITHTVQSRSHLCICMYNYIWKISLSTSKISILSLGKIKGQRCSLLVECFVCKHTYNTKRISSKEKKHLSSPPTVPFSLSPRVCHFLQFCSRTFWFIFHKIKFFKKNVNANMIVF